MFLNKDIEIMETKIVIYEDANGEIKLDVSLENDTLWLSQKQLEVLFDRDGIGRFRLKPDIVINGGK
ncbi:MAG TPA: hypothetical protein PLF55_00395, partial [Aliarcobacter cryaerophilus]|nr:hypothetical protein [Aliarcobacter cryaerophilus]